MSFLEDEDPSQRELSRASSTLVLGGTEPEDKAAAADEVTSPPVDRSADRVATVMQWIQEQLRDGNDVYVEVAARPNHFSGTEEELGTVAAVDSRRIVLSDEEGWAPRSRALEFAPVDGSLTFFSTRFTGRREGGGGEESTVWRRVEFSAAQKDGTMQSEELVV